MSAYSWRTVMLTGGDRAEMLWAHHVADRFFETLGAGLFFGVAPALRASRVDLNEALKEGSRGAASGRRSRRPGELLVIKVDPMVALRAE